MRVAKIEEADMTLTAQARRAMELAGDLPTGLAPPELRVLYAAQRARLQPPRPAVARAEDIQIPGRDGPLAARLYVPRAGGGPRPMMLYFHGGGWVVGSLDGYDTTCRRLALKADCVVLSVDYRLAPENPFPAAVHDAWDATIWAADAASGLGGDPRRLVVAGDSAGGTLAAVVSLMARDAGAPAIALQALIYPVADMTRETDSHVRNAQGYMLTTAALRWFYDRYVPDPAQRADWRASPLLAPSLAGVAPALVIAAEHDPLADEDAAYADRLRLSGVAVEHVCFPGMLHPFFTLGGVIDEAARAEDLVAAAIARLG